MRSNHVILVKFLDKESYVAVANDEGIIRIYLVEDAVNKMKLLSDDMLPVFIKKGKCINDGSSICNLGYACDGCPYNKSDDSKEDFDPRR